MRRTLAILTLLLIVSVPSRAQIANELIGRYQMEAKGGGILELRADGTASLAGQESRWAVSGNQISFGNDVMQYKLQGKRLLLTAGSIQIPWNRISGAVKAQSSKQNDQSGVKAKKPGAGETDADREAKQVLTGTAWCSFTYNKVSGTSTTRKVVFRPDGVMSVNGGAETYSSGYGGTYAGQSNRAGTMRWKLENLRMYVDQGDGVGFQDIGLTATKNSNGYVILHAGGREYSMCK